MSKAELAVRYVNEQEQGEGVAGRDRVCVGRGEVGYEDIYTSE